MGRTDPQGRSNPGGTLTIRLGTVEAGKLADLIVVEKNPLEHISNLRTLSMVIKDGKLVNLARDEGQTSFWKLYFLD